MTELQGLNQMQNSVGNDKLIQRGKISKNGSEAEAGYLGIPRLVRCSGLLRSKWPREGHGRITEMEDQDQKQKDL
jgi:hypothetical protein